MQFFSLNTQEVQFVCGLYVDLHRLSLGHALYVNKYFQLKLKEPIFHIKRKHVRVWNTYFAKEYMKDLNAFFWDKRSHRIKNAIFLSWEGTYHTGCNQFPNPLPTMALIQQCSRLFHTHIHRSTLQSEPGVMHKS